MRKSTLLSVALLLLMGPRAANAARVDPAGLTASSTYPPEEGFSYDPERATDEKLSTCWVEGDEGGGLGSWLELDLGSEQTLHKLRIWGGMWYSHDYWLRANRPKEIEVLYSDGSKDNFTLADEMTAQDFALGSGKQTRTLRIRVKSIYNGNTWLDTAISEVQVFDASAEASAPVRSVLSSSTLPADADGSYVPTNIGDGLLDSMWCEGSKTGDGTGEWLEVQFAGTQSVSEMTLVNGIGSSLSYWMKANRAAAATLTFSDGSSQEVSLKNAMMPQTIAFAAKSTSSVRITFGGVVKGKEFNDLCISEAYFTE
jgi:hypothetical protein